FSYKIISEFIMADTNNFLSSLPNFGVIQISGNNAATFLQGQLTCDINQVSDITGLPGALCNHKGRMLATFWIWKQEKTYFLLIPAANMASIIQHLNKFAVFSKVSVSQSM